MSILLSSYLAERQMLISMGWKEVLLPMAGKPYCFLPMGFVDYVNLNISLVCVM